MKNVLHITTHMGGGVGKVLSGICVYAENNKGKYKHRIILLEQPEKLNFIEICQRNGVAISVAEDMASIEKAMQWADIVQLEWWHHPLMADFLAKFPQITVRMVIWSHIAGTYYPWINPQFIKIPDKFLFTSACSYENKYWQASEREMVSKHTVVVNSSGGFPDCKCKKENHKEFNIGYVGTQAYSKINNDFIAYCKAVAERIPEAIFTLVGDVSNKKALLQAAEQAGILERFKFIDYVDDVHKEFAKMDVFGYLLNPLHFGTTENVLLEAMVAELPVICLNQAAEKHIVENGINGVLVNNKQEYVIAMLDLYNNRFKGKALGIQARKDVLANFNVKNTVNKLNAIYDEVMEKEKRRYNFNDIFGNEPYEYFLACLPPDLADKFNDFDKCIDKAGLPVILLEKNKSSLSHFARNYPQDELLRKWTMEALQDV